MSFGSKKQNYDYIGANLNSKIVYTSMTMFFICSLCVSTSINLSACLSVSLSDFNGLKILSRTSVVFRFFYKYAFFFDWARERDKDNYTWIDYDVLKISNVLANRRLLLQKKSIYQWLWVTNLQIMYRCKENLWGRIASRSGTRNSSL